MCIGSVKGDMSGEHGNREWTLRIYSADNTETPNRHNRMSFYHFSVTAIVDLAVTWKTLSCTALGSTTSPW